MNAALGRPTGGTHFQPNHGLHRPKRGNKCPHAIRHPRDLCRLQKRGAGLLPLTGAAPRHSKGVLPNDSNRRADRVRLLPPFPLAPLVLLARLALSAPSAPLVPLDL
jgi:hypothetical protein